MLCSFSRDIHNRYHVHEHTHHVDSALEIQQNAHHSCIYYIQSYCAIRARASFLSPLPCSPPWGIWSRSAAGCMVIKMGDAIKYDFGGDVHTGSDIMSLTPFIENVLPPSLPPPNAYRPMPNIPSFHLTSVLNSSSRAAPSSTQMPRLASHPPHLPPLCALSFEMYKSPSETNSNPLSSHTLPTPRPSCGAYRMSQTGNHSFHSINMSASKYSSESSLSSNFLSAVKSSTADYTNSATSQTPPHTPCTLNTSTYLRASSSTSSHQTTGSSSAVHIPSDTQSSLLPTSKNLIPITSPPMTSPNSNLTSDDLMGINGNLPELLHLPNDFLPTTKKLIDHKHGDKIWRYAVHFDRSLPEKNPTYSQMESFLEKINIFYEEANDNLTKCLLSFLKVHCLFLNFVIL